MAKISTKERILDTALKLYNEEGLTEISNVDIAAVMGISPGNLHYHYKGKSLIIEDLFSRFETEMKMVLGAPIRDPLALEDNWIYLYIIFEEIYDFRFFYRNLGWVFEKMPEITPRFARLMRAMQNAMDSLFGAIADRGLLDFLPEEREALTERLAMHFTYWLSYYDLRYPGAAPKTIINHGVYAALMQVTPYWAGDRDNAGALLSEFLAGQGA